MSNWLGGLLEAVLGKRTSGLPELNASLRTLLSLLGGPGSGVGSSGVGDGGLAGIASLAFGKTGRSGTAGLVAAIGGPVLGGLLNLFVGDGEKVAPAPVPRLVLPASLRVEAAYLRNQQAASFVERDETGGSRPGARAGFGVRPEAARVGAVQGTNPDDIAEAVKQALLQSHSLRDTLTEL